MITTQIHHTAKREIAPGIWQVSRPLRDTSWWHRRKSERACRRNVGHCWHPEGLIDWWCCMCSAETDGMPAHRCVVCAEVRRLNPVTPSRDEAVSDPSDHLAEETTP